MLAEHGEGAGHIYTFNTQGAPTGTQPAAGPFRGGVRPTGAGRSSGQSALSLVESWAGSMGTLREPQSVGVTRQEGLRECTVATSIRTGLSCVVSSHPGAETRDGHLAGAHAAREATRPPAANPAARQMEEIAESAAIGLGPTFFLTRGGIDRSTEGVVAPTRLLELGISSMLDLADAFSEEEEVRSACGAADQTSQDLAVQAWQQCRRRAPALAKMLAARQVGASSTMSSRSSSSLQGVVHPHSLHYSHTQNYHHSHHQPLLHLQPRRLIPHRCRKRTVR